MQRLLSVLEITDPAQIEPTLTALVRRMDEANFLIRKSAPRCGTSLISGKYVSVYVDDDCQASFDPFEGAKLYMTEAPVYAHQTSFRISNDKLEPYDVSKVTEVIKWEIDQWAEYRRLMWEHHANESRWWDARVALHNAFPDGTVLEIDSRPFVTKRAGDEPCTRLWSTWD